MMKHTENTYHGSLFRAQACVVSENLQSQRLPPHNGTATSIAAAEAAQHKINATHERILALFDAPMWRDKGLTQADAHELTGISRQTLCPRFSELEKAGKIRKTDRKRSSIGTLNCAVYEIVRAKGGGE